MEIKYDKQEKDWLRCLEDKSAYTWLKENTLDRWRHKRLLNEIKPLLKEKSTWLTLGDGRYGTEAHFIIENGGDAYASDISDKLLKEGHEIGFINKYGSENAENLSFDDESFDYVLIKEAFHHFPRPWLALYEAFRVCKKGVILIEPTDKKGLARKIRKIIKFILNRPTSDYGFEKIGNFVYSINNTEIEKFLLGMHYRNVAFKYMNDHYTKGVEFVELKTKSLKDKFKIFKLKAIISFKDFICLFFNGNYELMLSILFKEDPDYKTINMLKDKKWIYKKLPENPYI